MRILREYQRCLVILFLVLITLMAWGKEAQSQGKYPAKDIQIIVSHSPGGGTDLVTRLAASHLKQKWGVPVIVVNKPGGNSVPATTEMYNSLPDGYTVLADCQPASSMMEVVVKDIPFKVMDRTFIAMISRGTLVFMVHPNSPYKTIEDVVKEAKRDTDNFTWTSLGGISGQDYVTRQFFKAIGVDVSKTKPVLCKGGSEAVPLVAGNNVKLGTSSPIAARAAAKAGLVRVLGVSATRDPGLPDVPTMAELGYPTVNFIYWIGFSGPPNLPPYIVDIWNKTLQELVKEAEFGSSMTKLGYWPFYLNSTDMKKHVINETDDVAQLYGLKKN